MLRIIFIFIIYNTSFSKTPKCPQNSFPKVTHSIPISHHQKALNTNSYSKLTHSHSLPPSNYPIKIPISFSSITQRPTKPTIIHPKITLNIHNTISPSSPKLNNYLHHKHLKPSSPFKYQNIFSKLGSSIITRQPSMNHLTNRNNIIIHFNNKKHSSITNITPINIVSKHKYFKENKSTIQNNVHIWKLLFQLELVINNKEQLLPLLNKVLLIYCNIFNNKNSRKIELNIFNDLILTKQYFMFIKISVICLMYIRFLLYEFEYENALKRSVKHLVFNVNDILLLMLNQTLHIDDDNMKLNDNVFFDKECLTMFMKLNKIHNTIAKTNESLTSFSLNLNIKIESVIVLLKQFSNNYFKVVYFKSVHYIISVLLKHIETYTCEHVIKIIINGVLYYILHNNNNNTNTNESNNSTDNKLTQTASGFHPNVNSFTNIQSIPYLPKLNQQNDMYTLVLDLDETLVHFYYVSCYIYIYK